MSNYNSDWNNGQPNSPQNASFTTSTQLPSHPREIAVLILGVMGVFLCQLLGPVAWIMGNKTKKEAAENGFNPNSTNLVVGWILGIIGTVILILGVALFGLIMVTGIFFTNAVKELAEEGTFCFSTSETQEEVIVDLGEKCPEGTTFGDQEAFEDYILEDGELDEVPSTTPR